MQEAWLRLQRPTRRDPRPARVADHRRRPARARRAAAARARGASATSARGCPSRWSVDADPADRVTLDESVGMALLVVLETLSAGRARRVRLHDVFGYDVRRGRRGVGTLAGGRAPARLAGAPARRRGPPAVPGHARAAAARVVEAFAAAAGDGDVDALLRLLDPGRGHARRRRRASSTRPRKPIEGADRRSRARLLALGRSGGRGTVARIVDVNGMPGLFAERRDGVATVVAFTVDDGRITAIDIVRNPDKLRRPAVVTRAQRWALGLLCVLWRWPSRLPALFAPADFFRTFPLGRGGSQALPPYNEHLTRDVGGLYLALRGAVRVGGGARSSARWWCRCASPGACSRSRTSPSTRPCARRADAVLQLARWPRCSPWDAGWPGWRGPTALRARPAPARAPRERRRRSPPPGADLGTAVFSAARRGAARRACTGAASGAQAARCSAPPESVRRPRPSEPGASRGRGGAAHAAAGRRSGARRRRVRRVDEPVDDTRCSPWRRAASPRSRLGRAWASATNRRRAHVERADARSRPRRAAISGAMRWRWTSQRRPWRSAKRRRSDGGKARQSACV